MGKKAEEPQYTVQVLLYPTPEQAMRLLVHAQKDMSTVHVLIQALDADMLEDGFRTKDFIATLPSACKNQVLRDAHSVFKRSLKLGRIPVFNRRTDRFLPIASALAANPSASLPHALETWGETQGADRRRRRDALPSRDLLGPHWSQVSPEATQGTQTRRLADLTALDVTRPQARNGRGPVGKSKEDIDFPRHPVLARNPHTQRIVGGRTQEPFLRTCAPVGETRAQRRKLARLGTPRATDRAGTGEVPMDRGGGEQQRCLHLVADRFGENKNCL